MLLRGARVDLGAMAMKRCSALPKAPALLEPHHQIVKCYIKDTYWGEVLPICKGTLGVFHSPSRLGNLCGLVWFYDISSMVGYLMPNLVYTYILNIYDLVWLVLWHINHCRLLNAKSSLYIYIKYIWLVKTFCRPHF